MVNETATAQRYMLSSMVEYLTGHRSATALSQSAAQLLGRTDDIPKTVIDLAIIDTSASREEVGLLVHAAARSFGYPALTPSFCSMVLALDIAQGIVAGHVPAGIGASNLWEVGRETVDAANQLGVFADLFDDWESNLAKREQVEDEIRQAASRFLAESETAYRGYR